MKTKLSFQQATESLRGFLILEKRPSIIHWIFRDDLLQYKRNVVLRWPLPKDNEQMAEQLYNAGRERGLGLTLEAYCFDRNTAYCYVLVPEDKYDSEALMMTELKLSFVTDHGRVWKIRTKWLWQKARNWIIKKPDTLWTNDLVPIRKAT